MSNIYIYTKKKHCKKTLIKGAYKAGREMEKIEGKKDLIVE